MGGLRPPDLGELDRENPPGGDTLDSTYATYTLAHNTTSGNMDPSIC